VIPQPAEPDRGGDVAEDPAQGSGPQEVALQAEARAQAAEERVAEEKAARRATEERLRALEEELNRLRKV
jgi:hypothetical protein